jgi:hypothetical protein
MAARFYNITVVNRIFMLLIKNELLKIHYVGCLLWKWVYRLSGLHARHNCLRLGMVSCMKIKVILELKVRIHEKIGRT